MFGPFLSAVLFVAVIAAQQGPDRGIRFRLHHHPVRDQRHDRIDRTREQRRHEDDQRYDKEFAIHLEGRQDEAAEGRHGSGDSALIL